MVDSTAVRGWRSRRRRLRQGRQRRPSKARPRTERKNLGRGPALILTSRLSTCVRFATFVLNLMPLATCRNNAHLKDVLYQDVRRISMHTLELRSFTITSRLAVVRISATSQRPLATVGANIEAAEPTCVTCARCIAGPTGCAMLRADVVDEQQLLTALVVSSLGY